MKTCDHCGKVISEENGSSYYVSDRFNIRTNFCSYQHYLKGFEYCVIPQYFKYPLKEVVNLG